MKHILSLFGGIECGREALKKACIPVGHYYSSEVDKYAIKAAKNAHPDVVHVGDVCKVKVSELPFVPDLLIGGSPCQGFSFAGKQLNFNDPRSALFFEFVRILKECHEINPNVLFMLENVPMKKEFQRVINEHLGIMPVNINAALVCAQNRNRLFWTNIRTRRDGLFGELISDIPQPADKGILLQDILEENVAEKYSLSDAAIARLVSEKRKLNPEKTYAVTRNSETLSGGRSRQGTLVGVVNDKGALREVTQSGCIDSGYAKGMDNHVQRVMVLKAQSVQIRPRYYENGTKRYGKKEGLSRTGTIEKNGDGTKSGTITRNENTNLVMCFQENHKDVSRHQQDGKRPSVTENVFVHNNHVQCVSMRGRVRRLTPVEVCRLFTLPDNYFLDGNGKPIVSESQMYRSMGNGWVVDVIAHIFSFIPKEK